MTTSMKAAEVEARVRALVAEGGRLDPASVGPRTPFADLGLDSVTSLDLIARLEESFDVRIPEADAVHLTCVESVVRFITRNAGR